MTSIARHTKSVVLPAGTNDDITLHADPTLVRTVVVIAGRATGTVTVTKKPVGATRFTAASPAATIDLTTTDEVVIEGCGLTAINVSDGGSGADLTVTVHQMAI